MPGSSTQVSLRLRTLPYSRLALSLRLGRALHDTPGSRPEVRGLDTHRPGRTRRRRPRTRPADRRTPPSRNRSYGGYCTATLNSLTRGEWPNSRKDALASSFENDALPRCQRAGEAQLVAVSVVDMEVALAPRCVRG